MSAIFVNPAFALDLNQLSANNDKLIASAKRLNLASHPIWHKLILYEENSSGRFGLKSAIHAPAFFNSDQGVEDPAEELSATLSSFFSPSTNNPDDHAQCKFRGRFVWLRSQLEFSKEDFDFVTCPAYSKWTSDNSVTSISIIFATGYLGNPASYYGHTLFKLNSNRTTNTTKLEDVSVNYGAIVPEGDGPISYMLNGLFGGYEAGFTHIQFYFHNHNYGENELRDMWEYELNFSDSELELILGHTWEVLGKEYTYYFLDENCAYRMGQLVEVIAGLDITPNGGLWTLPQALVQKLAIQQRDGVPLVKAIRYLPSRQSRLYQRFSRLSIQEKKVVARLVNNTNLLENSDFTNLDLNSKHRILDTLLDYFQFVRDPDVLSKDKNNERYRITLAHRYRLPTLKTEKQMLDPPAPHLGRKSSLLGISLSSNQRHGVGTSIKIRPAYYDELDSDFSHIKNSMLKMAEIELKYFHERNHFQLQQLDFFAIESVNTQVTGLPGDTNKAWRLKGGLELQNLACSDCLVARGQADIGKAILIGNSIVVRSYIGGAIQENKHHEGFGFLRASVVVGLEFSQKIRVQISAEKRNYFSNSINRDTIWSAQARWAIATNYDLRFSYKKNLAEETSVSLNTYW